MKITFISGQPGAGKTSVGKELLTQIEHSAYIDADSLCATNPFDFTVASI